jgi:tetratricopeptide (TPR) repeat protein
MFDMRMLREAENDLKSAYALNKGFSDDFVKRAMILYSQNKYQEIISEFQKFRLRLEYRPDAMIFLEVGRAHIALKNYESALSVLSTGCNIASKKKHVLLLQIGLCYCKQGHWQKAINALNNCLQIQHNYAEVL